MDDRIGVQIVASRAEYLGMLLTSLMRQTMKNWDLFLVIQDKTIVENHYIKTLFQRLDYEGHRIKILLTQEKGIGNLRNLALKQCDTNIGVRIDDDSICEPDYLATLYHVLDSERDNKVGVVGGGVPYIHAEKTYHPPKELYNKITKHFVVTDDSTAFYNVPKYSYYPADTLRSAYMYFNETMRKVMFPTCFDEYAGFREETLPLVHLKMMGYKHYYAPNAICWHFGAPSGGTREAWNKKGHTAVWDADEIFLRECNKLRGEFNGKV